MAGVLKYTKNTSFEYVQVDSDLESEYKDLNTIHIQTIHNFESGPYSNNCDSCQTTLIFDHSRARERQYDPLAILIVI